MPRKGCSLTFAVHSVLRRAALLVTPFAVLAAATPAVAQEEAEGTLGELVVTAQRRAENVQDVPISVSAVDEERLQSMFEGGEDIRALATRVPSLYAESSNGRLAPRFYIRGLGNSDFDLAASQPVSIIVDEVVLENVVLKSFPLFDIERVEVLRGPQGTLFGRNTPAGIVKFDTKKPKAGFEADVGATYGDLGTMILQGAVGGGSDTLSGRVSVMYQEREDWIDNGFTGEEDAIGGFDELAYRAQLLISPSDSFSALLNVHGRDMSDGTASIFRANVLSPGSNEFNGNYDRETVYFDAGDNNPQEAEAVGGSLRLDFEMGGGATITSITAYESVENTSRGDIDGGACAPLGSPVPPGLTSGATDCFFPFGAGNDAVTYPGFIPFASDTQDGLDDLDQLTEEIRIASQASDRLFWQAGLFYFDSEFSVTTNPFFTPVPTTVTHENTAWAVFGHVSYDMTEALTFTGGVRYTDDEKDLTGTGPTGDPIAPVNVADEQVSWDLSLLYKVNDDFNLYGRLANGFRAPTIQARDVAFFGAPSTADSETINSIEAGFKSELAGNRVRLSGAVFYYEVEDMQFSAIGGAGNLIQLVNADKGTGMGFDLEAEFLATDNLLFTAGLSYADTEIDDPNLRVAPCGSGQCTVTDELDGNGNAIVDGNAFTQAPEYIATVTARYGIPMGNGELFFFTDWAFQGETQFFLYESEEYFSEDTFEGGARIGYSHNGGQWEVALFGRNITDEENVKGGIDFNNLTAFDNEPRIVGITVSARFE